MLLNNALARVKFKKRSYTKSDGSQVSFEDVSLYTCLVSLSQTKQIIKTMRTGANGSVKEYIGMDDYAITITGSIHGKNNVRPVDEILALKKMLECPVPIDVVCGHLQDYGIFTVVVESYEIPETAGGISFQDFTINLVSDTAVELKIASV